MSVLGAIPIPEPPDFRIDFDALDEAFDFMRALHGCPQDPVHHAEGDVAIHTRMVCEALVALAAFRALPGRDRAITFVSALLHDVAKPECTRTEENGRITSRGHSARGESLARRILYDMDVELAAREEVARIIEVHQFPFFTIDKPDAARVVHTISQRVRIRALALVAEADIRGRVCHDQAKLLDQIALFRELADEEGCLDHPRAFVTDHARFTYFKNAARDAGFVPYDDTWGTVTLLSGLPASGKDTWIRQHARDMPVVSLDALREALDVDPESAQGEVVAAAKAEARAHLRAKRPFVWNATNLTRTLRASLVSLFTDYGARVRIAYLETSRAEQRERNTRRARTVPGAVVARMVDKLQVPDRTEAHEVSWNGAAAGYPGTEESSSPP